MRASIELWMHAESRESTKEAFEWRKTKPSASLAFRMLSKFSKFFYNSINAQLKARTISFRTELLFHSVFIRKSVDQSDCFCSSFLYERLVVSLLFPDSQLPLVLHFLLETFSKSLFWYFLLTNILSCVAIQMHGHTSLEIQMRTPYKKGAKNCHTCSNRNLNSHLSLSTLLELV